MSVTNRTRHMLWFSYSNDSYSQGSTLEETAHIIKLNTEAVQNIAFLPKGQDIIKKSQQDFQLSAKEAIKTY